MCGSETGKQHPFQFKGFDILPVLAFFAALLFTAGWSYAYHYFSYFHIGLLSIEIPYHHFFLYGFWVITDNIFWLTLLSIAYFLAVFSIGLIAKIRWIKQAWIQRSLIAIIALPLIASTFLFADYFAKKTADSRYLNEKNSDYASYPRIRVWMKTTGKESEEDKEFNKSLQSGSYRLLLQDSKNLFLFYSFKDKKNAKRVKLPTVVTPLHAINHMRILPQYTSLR